MFAGKAFGTETLRNEMPMNHTFTFMLNLMEDCAP